MNVKDVTEAMRMLENYVHTANAALSQLPGYQGVKLSARFKDEDGRKGVDVVMDSDGNLAVQPQSYTQRGERS